MDEFGERVAGTLGRRIRRRRRFLNLSQEALAERAGIHRTQISFFEHGKRMPLVVTLMKLASALEVSVAQLLAGVEWEVQGGGHAEASAEVIRAARVLDEEDGSGDAAEEA